MAAKYGTASHALSAARSYELVHTAAIHAASASDGGGSGIASVGAAVQAATSLHDDDTKPCPEIKTRP